MTNEHQPNEATSTTDLPAPHIYVASLADYNDGRLHGCWLDATAEQSDLETRIQQMLARSRQPGAEEVAIHDYEGFCGLRLSEFEALPTVIRLAHGIRNHGPPFAAWAQLTGIDEASEADFRAHYLGSWSDLRAFGEDFALDLGLEQHLSAVPANLRHYVHIDHEALVRDMQLGGEIATVAQDDRLDVFLSPGTG
jgi:antirestriction protein